MVALKPGRTSHFGGLPHFVSSMIGVADSMFEEGRAKVVVVREVRRRRREVVIGDFIFEVVGCCWFGCFGCGRGCMRMRFEDDFGL